MGCFYQKEPHHFGMTHPVHDTTIMKMKSPETVLLTGACGKLARRLRLPLAGHYKHLRVTDLLPLEQMSDNEEPVTCDLSDRAAVEKLVDGVDAIVHFAGYPREADWEAIFPANMVATVNLFEAAMGAGVRRVVYASTNHTTGFYPNNTRIGLHDEVKPDTRYGVSKAFAETLARFYYEKFGVESLGIRIGRCEDKPTDERMMANWLHPADMVQLVKLGLEHPVRADLIYGVSRNARSPFNNAAQTIPYVPEHSADDYTLDANAPPSAVWHHQGGPFAAQQYVGDPERAAQFFRSFNPES